eukprot:1046402-Pyramimonas_sp.AAC.1
MGCLKNQGATSTLRRATGIRTEMILIALMLMLLPRRRLRTRQVESARRSQWHLCRGKCEMHDNYLWKQLHSWPPVVPMLA